MATKKATTKATKRKSPARKTLAPVALSTTVTTTIEAAEGADFKSAAGAVLTDLQRRLASGSLTSLELTAYGRGTRIVVDL